VGWFVDSSVTFQVGFDILEDKSRVFPVLSTSSPTVWVYSTVRIGSAVQSHNTALRTELGIFFEPRLEFSSANGTSSDAFDQATLIFSTPTLRRFGVENFDTYEKELAKAVS
jgi:hypothetical protein